MTDYPLMHITTYDDNGKEKSWYVPQPTTTHEACEGCTATDSQTEGLASYLCDNCNAAICLWHSYWWTYGQGGSRIICEPCLSELRAIEERASRETDASDYRGDLGAVLHCATGRIDPM